MTDTCTCCDGPVVPGSAICRKCLERNKNMSTNGSDTKEDFSQWFIVGSSDNVFIGKVSEAEFAEGNVSPGKKVILNPCYQYKTHMMQIPQQDGMGRIVGYGLAMQEMVSTPAGLGKDVSMVVLLSWIMVDSKEVQENIARLVKIAREQQVAMRSAAAGIQTAGRVRL